MSGTLEVAAYVEFLAKEYLADFVGRGGSSVKFCVGDEAARAALRQGLEAVAAADGYAYAAVDAAATRVHMVDQLSFAVARSLDVDALGGKHHDDRLSGGRVSQRRLGGLGVETVAAHHGVDPSELNRSVRRRLEQTCSGTPPFRGTCVSRCPASPSTGWRPGMSTTPSTMP